MATFDLMLRRLSELPGEHLHIGMLPETEIEAFSRTAERRRAGPRALPPPASCPGLWPTCVIARWTFAFRPSPSRGAKGLVETQGAGVPVVMNESGLSKHHSTRELIYDEAPWWQTPDQLLALLRG